MIYLYRLGYLHISVDACIYIYMYMRYIRICTYLHIYIYIFACVCAYPDIYIYVDIHACTCIYRSRMTQNSLVVSGWDAHLGPPRAIVAVEVVVPR